MRKIYLSILIFALLTSCKDSTIADYSALGGKQKVEQISGGKVMHTWISSGKVSKDNVGYYFMDDSTGKLTRVSGTVNITPYDDDEQKETYEIVPLTKNQMDSLILK